MFTWSRVTCYVPSLELRRRQRRVPPVWSRTCCRGLGPLGRRVSCIFVSMSVWAEKTRFMRKLTCRPLSASCRQLDYGMDLSNGHVLSQERARSDSRRSIARSAKKGKRKGHCRPLNEKVESLEVYDVKEEKVRQKKMSRKLAQRGSESSE